ncbi:hypothetical protein RvY_16224-1 [Ramazzottius varieornatus]|uniref:Uncharacterized protein n=1 Tax=Ramazzottius varieornatus TaxID=947166 RepID=A0A1D1W251_RAMVA|nr:hypothetical protein RvY_16224-1 [Ramazzottius varieornatus]
MCLGCAGSGGDAAYGLEIRDKDQAWFEEQGAPAKNHKLTSLVFRWTGTDCVHLHHIRQFVGSCHRSRCHRFFLHIPQELQKEALPEPTCWSHSSFAFTYHHWLPSTSHPAESRPCTSHYSWSASRTTENPNRCSVFDNRTSSSYAARTETHSIHPQTPPNATHTACTNKSEAQLAVINQLNVY